MRTTLFVDYMNYILDIVNDDTLNEEWKIFNIRENVKEWIKDETWRNPGALRMVITRKDDGHMCSGIEE